jgi:hypothetical protein
VGDGNTSMDVAANAAANADPVELACEMTPLQLANVLTVVTLSGPFTIAVMLSGPVVIAVGAIAGDAQITLYGALLAIALPAVPLAAFGVAYVNSLRKGSVEVLAPVRVRAEEKGVSIETGDSRRWATWDHFTRWRRAAGAYVLYTGPRTFIVLRESGLTPQKAAAFEALLRGGISRGPRR